MEPFILFGDQHVSTMIWTGIIIVLFCILGNFINTKSQDLVAKLIGLSLIIFEITKPFIYIYGFDKPWQTYLPLHMCNFSAVLIGIFLLSKEKNQLFFELPFYWGIGGATMAILHQILILHGQILSTSCSFMVMVKLFWAYFLH